MINASSLKDRTVADELCREAEGIAAEAIELEREIIEIVKGKIA